jgi:transposase
LPSADRWRDPTGLADGQPAINVKAELRRLQDPALSQRSGPSSFSYQDLAAHYGTTIMPTRPRKPRDKAKVEVAVQIAQRWILARLRDRRFFSLAELNVAIRARSCLGILSLARSYGPIRLEAACRRGVVIGAASYRSIASILKTGLDKAFMPDPEPDADPIHHGNIRGRSYYH